MSVYFCEQTTDLANIVVFIPGPAILVPNGVLNPLLGVLIEIVHNILFWDPALYVVFLHLNNPDRVLRD